MQKLSVFATRNMEKSQNVRFHVTAVSIELQAVDLSSEKGSQSSLCTLDSWRACQEHEALIYIMTKGAAVLPKQGGLFPSKLAPVGGNPGPLQRRYGSLAGGGCRTMNRIID